MKKKIFSLLLVFVMLVSMFPMNVFAADGCSGNYNGEHYAWSYTKGEGTHSFECMLCDEEVTEPCTYGSWSNGYDGTHKASCSKCGSTKNEAHTMGLTNPMDGYHKDACTVCGYSTSNSPYGTPCSSDTWLKNDTHHYKVCAVCNKEFSKINHDFETVANNDGTHSQKCEGCGYAKDAAPCNYKYDSYDSEKTASGHTLVCEDCGHESASQAHTMGYEFYYNGQHYHCCTVCGYGKSYSNLKSCTYTYVNNGTTHTATCKDCGNVVRNQSHSYSNGFCACSAEKHDHNWSLNVSGNKIIMTCTAGGTCEYGKKGGELSISASDSVYDGTAKNAKAVVTLNSFMARNGNISVSYFKKSGGNYSQMSGVPTNVGEYKAVATYRYGNLSEAVSVDYKITKKNVTVTASGYEGVYDGNAHGITVNAPEGLTVEYSNNGSYWGTASLYNRYTDAGTYTVHYKVVDNSGNYNITNATGTRPVKITKAKVTVSATGYEGDYDGAYHGITVNVPKGLTVTYSETENSFYNYSTSPTYKNAGTYTVYYKVSGNDNYEITGATGSATVKINKLQASVTASGYEGVYDGNAHGITVNAPEGMTVEYSNNGTNWGPASWYNSFTDAGEYTVYYKVSGNANYEITDATGSKTVKITKAQKKVTASGYEGVYDGDAHGITVNVPSELSVTYCKTEDGHFSASAPTFTDVGEYTVYYKVSGNDNYDIIDATGSAVVKITPFDLAPVVNAESPEFTYNRSDYTNEGSYTPHSIKVNVGELPNYETATVEYSIDGVNWSTQNPRFTDAGVYTVKYRVFVAKSYYGSEHSKNYKDVEGSATVTINKAELPITALVGYHGPYDGSTHYGFAYKYSTSYGDYFTLYWYDYLHEELDYSFSWKDESGASRSLTVNAGETPKLTDFPGFTKQNVEKVDETKDTTDPRVHKVTVTIGNNNYNDKTFTYYVQIGPGGAIAKDTSYTYDGDEHYIANYIFGHWYYGYGEIYNRGSVKIEYKEHGTDEWLPFYDEPGQTEVGYKDVDWRVTMDSDRNGEFGEEENSFGSKEVFEGTNRVTVTGAPLTVTAKDKTITYGDALEDAEYTVTGFVNGENESAINKTSLVYTSDYDQYDPVGTYSFKPEGLIATNYIFNYVAGTLTVVAKEVDVVADATELEYDASKESNVPNFTVDPTDLVNGDACSVTATYEDANGNPVAAPKEPGTYKAKFTLGNDNYAPKNTITFTIVEKTPVQPEKKDITLNWGSLSFVYNGAHQAPTVTATGMEEGDSCTLNVTLKADGTAVTATKNVGTYTIEVEIEGLSGDKYNLPTELSKTYTITQKEIGLEWGSLSFVYNGAHQAPTVKATDLIGDDTCELTVELYVKGSTTPVTETKEVGEYTIKVVGLSNGNYKLPAEVEKDYTITKDSGNNDPIVKKDITLEWGPLSFVYNGAHQAPTVTVNGVDEGDTCTLKVTLKAEGTAVTATKNVGTYTIEVEIEGLSGDKYNLPTELSKTYTITKAPLTVKAKDITITYGAEPEFGYEVDGLKGDDTESVLTGTAKYAIEKKAKADILPVGEYEITISGLDAANYEIKFVKGKLTVVPEKDDTPPVIGKVEDGGTYYDDTDFTVTDDNLDKVTVDGKEVKPDANGDYTIPADNKEHTIVAVDEAGNTTTAKITVYKTYTVKYVASGKLVSEQKVGHGKDAVAPTVPEVEGYYGKWNKDGKNITADTTITAIYYDNNGVVRTGDETNAMLWAGLMFSGMAGLYGVAMYLKRKEEEE